MIKRMIMLLALPFFFGASAMADDGDAATDGSGSDGETTEEDLDAAYWDEAYQWWNDNFSVVVELKGDGGFDAYKLADAPKLTHEGDQFVVTVGDKKVSHLRDSVHRYTFGCVFELSDTVFMTHKIYMLDYRVAKLGRTLQPGLWNTFCVPFPMNKKQVVETFGEGTQLRSYKGHVGAVLKFQEADSIENGVAYLVKPTKLNVNPIVRQDKRWYTYEGETYSGFAVAVIDTVAAAGVDADGYGLQGCYSPTVMKTDGSQLFVTADGKLKKPAEGKNTLKGMRAYIVVPQSSDAKSIALDIDGDGTLTTLDELTGRMAKEDENVYRLSGQPVNPKQNLPKGIYVKGGRKVVVK